MSTPSDLTSWPADAPEADVAEEQRNEPLLDGSPPARLADADEADLVEQSRELPWEDGDEER